MKFAAIRLDTTGIPVAWKCSAFSVTEQGYYMHCRRSPSLRANHDVELTAAIAEAHKISRHTYGTKRLKTALEAEGKQVSRRRIARLRNAAGLKIKCAKKFTRTTDSNHDYPIAPNLLNRKFWTNAPNTIWVSDITYVWTRDHWLYLCTIIDLFSNLVVGRTLSDSLGSSIVTDTLKMAIASRRPPPGCIFHSDRGVQYGSHAVRATLLENKFRQSMSRKGDCWDNAVAESSFARLKGELGDNFDSDAEAVRSIYEYLDVFHNHIRIHSRIGTTPFQFESKSRTTADMFTENS